MIKILTAIGNPELNNDLRKYQEFQILGNDILYMEGILEVLEINSDADYLIISEVLQGEINLTELVDKIYLINKKIKIILILNEKNNELEEVLIRKGVHDILYNRSDINEIINLLKTKNIENLNKELRLEVENLKKMIIENNKNKRIKNKNYNKNDGCKILTAVGNRGTGKTSFLFFLSNILKEKNKILFVDLNINKNDANYIFDFKKEYSEAEKINIKNYKKNLDIISNLNYLINYKNKKIEEIFEQINKIKNNYNYIFIDYNFNANSNNAVLYNMCTDILFLTKINNFEVKKSKELLNDLSKKIEKNTKKIKIIIYGFSIFDYLIIKRINKKNNLFTYKILEKIKYFSFYNLYIKYKKLLKINIFFKIKCLQLAKKLSIGEWLHGWIIY